MEKIGQITEWFDAQKKSTWRKALKKVRDGPNIPRVDLLF